MKRRCEVVRDKGEEMEKLYNIFKSWYALYEASLGHHQSFLFFKGNKNNWITWIQIQLDQTIEFTYLNSEY
jgi:hypothetical protein